MQRLCMPHTQLNQTGPQLSLQVTAGQATEVLKQHPLVLAVASNLKLLQDTAWERVCCRRL